MLTGFWTSGRPVRWAGGSSLSPGAPRGLPAPSSAHREGQGLGDPPLQAPRGDTQLCHQPGDEGKASWRKGDRSQGGITCCRRRFLSALSPLSPLLGCPAHTGRCHHRQDGGSSTGQHWGHSVFVSSSGCHPGCQLKASPRLPKAFTDPAGSISPRKTPAESCLKQGGALGTPEKQSWGHGGCQDPRAGGKLGCPGTLPPAAPCTCSRGVQRDTLCPWGQG